MRRVVEANVDAVANRTHDSEKVEMAKVNTQGMVQLPVGYDYINSISQKGEHKHRAYYREISPKIQNLRNDAAQMYADLEHAIANCKDPDKLQAMNAALQELDDAVSKMLHEPPGSQHSFTEWKSYWQNNMNRVSDALVNAQVAKLDAEQSTLTPTKMRAPAREATVQGTASSGGLTQTKMENPVREAEMVDTTPASGASSASGSSAATGAGDEVFGGKTVEEMANMMKDNPEALMEHLDDLPHSQKQAAMQAIQERLQEINQMYSMLSNMQKSMHDTSKAIINNMRV